MTTEQEWKYIAREVAKLWKDQVEMLGKQLADEREKHDLDVKFLQAVIDKVESENIAGNLSPEALAKHDAEVLERLIEIVKAELDNCDHPECIKDRRQKGFSSCAGGHLGKQVIDALAKVKEGK